MYLQTSAVGTASLFGPAAVQALMSGQAAVAVVVSGTQLLSAATSLWGTPREQFYVTGDGRAEERAAFLFFGLATIFLFATTGAHAWLTTMPVYKAVMRPSEVDNATAEERQGLFSAGLGGGRGVIDSKSKIWRVAKANAIYEAAVAYVFIVTLVGSAAIRTFCA